MQEKLYVVRKYIMAKSAADAIKKDKVYPVDDLYVDETWKDKQIENIGFQVRKK